MAQRWVHRQDDLRDCNARTVTQCTDVRVNNKFISIDEDPNTHRNGRLRATITRGSVHVNNKPVILINDPAGADSLCPGGSHCNPRAATASSDVRAGNNNG
jgi:hypothetical protein